METAVVADVVVIAVIACAGAAAAVVIAIDSAEAAASEDLPFGAVVVQAGTVVVGLRTWDSDGAEWKPAAAARGPRIVFAVVEDAVQLSQEQRFVAFASTTVVVSPNSASCQVVHSEPSQITGGS